MVSDSTITSADVQDSSLTGADIQDGSIETADIAPGAVVTADLADGAVTTTKIADAAITAQKLAPGVSFAPTWVSFDGTDAANPTATYSQSGTTVTITLASHGLLVGHIVSLDFTSGTATDGVYIVQTVPSSSTFTVAMGSSATTSGSVVLRRCPVAAGNNVASIADCATGDYGINFAAPLADGNYAVAGMATAAATNNPKTTINFHATGQALPPTTKTAAAVRILVGSTNQTPPAGVDCASISLIILR
jgi:hypothetical protein